MHPDRIILVYNEGSGLFDAIGGWSHKLLSPATYQCALCKSTFGLTGMLVPWKNYLEMLPFPATFLHRDAFWKQFPAMEALALPAILTEKAGRIETLLSADDLRDPGGLATLIGLMQERLEQWSRTHATTGIVK